MFLKLFIAMGLTWIFELIALAISHLTDEGDVPQWVSIILNIANVLQGIIIFFVFGFKPSVRDRIREKYHERSSQTRHGRKISKTESSSVNSFRRNSMKATPTLMKNLSYSPSSNGSDVEFAPASDNEESK